MDALSKIFMTGFGEEVVKNASGLVAAKMATEEKLAITGQRVRQAIVKRLQTYTPKEMSGIIRAEPRRALGAGVLTATLPKGTLTPSKGPAIGGHAMARAATRQTQELFPKKTAAEDVTSDAGKTAAPVAEAAPAAKSLAGKLVDVMRRRPVMTAATAAAAGAGTATGVAEAKKKKEEEERRREQVRQILIQRLSEAGYGG
jgi:hypothetical protein